MHVYSLYEIVTAVEQSFREVLSEFHFFCTAEVLKVKSYGSRYYVDLVQYNEQGGVVAKLQGIIRDTVVLKDFLQQVGRTSEQELVGKSIMLGGYCSFHHMYGLSVSIQELSAAYVLGKMQQEIHRIRLLLQQKGIYLNNKSCSLSEPPVHLALISSPTSEGLQDFCTMLDKSPFQITREVIPATVHGNKAKEEVAAALQYVHQRSNEGTTYSAVYLLRGGGGREGFQRQNDQIIAEHICTLGVPVIVAIGHTTDNSLLDEICRYAAQTPSEAATHLLSILTTRQQSLTSLYASIHTAAVSYHTKMTPLLTQTYEFIRYLFRSRLEQYHQQLEHARSAIRCFSPETIYAKGFATVHSSDGSFLSAQKLKALQTGTKITIKTVNGTREATVE